MRPTLVLGEASAGLRRNMTMTTAAILVSAIALALAGSGWLITTQMNQLKDFWYGKIEVSIYLCGTNSDATVCPDGAVTPARRTQIQQELQGLPQVEQVYYESQAEAYAHFKEQMAGSAILQYVTPDALPESFRVKLVNPDQDYSIVASKFEGSAGVERVVDQRKILDKLFAALNGFRVFAWLLMLVMLVTMVLLIFVVIRVAAFSRRRETGIMRLVGASNFSIQAPFLLEGVFVGVVGALLASVLLWLGYVFLIGSLRRQIQFVNFIGASAIVSTSLWLLLLGAVVTAVVSFISLQLYLRV
jgi:cell division transport system permease protein